MNTNEIYQKDIKALRGKVLGREAEKKAHTSEKIKAQKEILDPAQLKTLYKTLEKSTNPVLEKMMETFVALLRNTESAGNDDVETYLRKAEHLQVAFNKLDPSKINKTYAEKHLTVLDSFQDTFI